MRGRLHPSPPNRLCNMFTGVLRAVQESNTTEFPNGKTQGSSLQQLSILKIQGHVWECKAKCLRDDLKKMKLLLQHTFFLKKSSTEYMGDKSKKELTVQDLILKQLSWGKIVLFRKGISPAKIVWSDIKTSSFRYYNTCFKIAILKPEFLSSKMDALKSSVLVSDR